MLNWGSGPGCEPWLRPRLWICATFSDSRREATSGGRRLRALIFLPTDPVGGPLYFPVLGWECGGNVRNKKGLGWVDAHPHHGATPSC